MYIPRKDEAVRVAIKKTLAPGTADEVAVGVRAEAAGSLNARAIKRNGEKKVCVECESRMGKK